MATASSSSVHVPKRKFLNLKDKMKVVEEIKLGKSPLDVAKTWGVSKSVVYKIVKSKDRIDKTLNEEAPPKDSKLMTTKVKFKRYR